MLDTMNMSLALIFAAVSQNLSIPPGLLSALCYTETKHVVKAVNINDGGSNSIGICQLKLRTARGVGYVGTEQELQNNPNTNIYYAGLYLRRQLDRYNGDTRKAISAYNAGTHRLSPEGKTRNRKYVSLVFKAWKENK